MIRKRGNSYEVRAYNPATRKSEYVGSRASRRDARELEREAEAGFARHRVDRATVAEFAEQWLELYAPKQLSSRRKRAGDIRRFIDAFGGDRRLDSITRLEARAYIVEKPSRLDTARKFFNDAIDAGVAHDNPFARLGLPKSKGRSGLLVLTDDELVGLEQFAITSLGEGYGPHFAACIRVAACTCIRPGELFALDWSRLDLAGQRADIAYQRPRGEPEARAPKYDSRRTIVVPAPAVEALEQMPRFDSDFVFGSITGKRMTHDTHTKSWDRVRCAAGRPGMDFYELRHYGATKLLELGVSAEDVAVQMGHKDGGTLVRTVYGHPSEERALDRVQQAWLRGSGGGETPHLQAVR